MVKGYLTIDKIDAFEAVKRMKSKCVENYAKQFELTLITHLLESLKTMEYKLSIKLLRGRNENIEKSIKIT